MSNYLKNKTSLYLKEYSDNSINWHPWGTASFKQAAQDQKPIFLSIGYSGSYWCEVMHEESFNDQTIIDLLNEHFIAIKVDRDEHTHIDKYYKQVYKLMNGQACSSPISLFLTEEGQPFYSATYIAPYPKGNVLGFETLLHTITQKYQNDKATMRKKAQEILDFINPKKRTIEATRLHADTLTNTITAHAIDLFDDEHTGFGTEPKFLHLSTLDLLLDTYVTTKNSTLLSLVDKTLTTIQESEIHDNQLGGFYRYAYQKDWSNPRQEKTSYDNAQLAMLFWRMYGLTEKISYRDTAFETVDFLLSSMRGEKLFYSHSVIKKNGSFITDTKAVTSFNAMVIEALLTVGQEELTYQDIGMETLDLLLKEMYTDNRLSHTEGIEGLLEDYAYLGSVLLQAYQNSNNSRYLILAEAIANQAIKLFYDYGFWKFANDEPLVYDEIDDSLYPSSLAVVLLFLHELSFFVDNDYNPIVFKSLEIHSYSLMRQPLSSPKMSKVLLKHLKKML